MPAKKTARPAKGKKAGVDATHDSSELPTGNAEIALPTDVQLINPLDESKTRISIEYARTIMAIGVFHVALRRPEMMKRRCAKVASDERRREVVISMSFNSYRSLTGVTQTCPKLSHRYAPAGR